jgi:hypothetical protein
MVLPFMICGTASLNVMYCPSYSTCIDAGADASAPKAVKVALKTIRIINVVSKTRFNDFFIIFLLFDPITHSKLE